jgi:hypothetical protein
MLSFSQIALLKFSMKYHQVLRWWYQSFFNSNHVIILMLFQWVQSPVNEDHASVEEPLHWTKFPLRRKLCWSSDRLMFRKYCARRRSSTWTRSQGSYELLSTCPVEEPCTQKVYYPSVKMWSISLQNFKWTDPDRHSATCSCVENSESYRKQKRGWLWLQGFRTWGRHTDWPPYTGFLCAGWNSDEVIPQLTASKRCLL